MKIIAVSVSKPIAIEYNGNIIKTGIFKKPVVGRLQATINGLNGDGQADLEAHGGADKAIYVYSKENYLYWENELGLSNLPYGQFGENLTVQDMNDQDVYIGDKFKIGGALVEVTQPRIPCFKLGIRMESVKFPRRFLQSKRVGFYVRVLQGGALGAGDSIEKMFGHPQKLSVAESLLALTHGPQQLQVILRALSIDALSDAWRKDLDNRVHQFS